MQLSCNICGSTNFKSFGANPRVNALCINCNSLERHRALHYFLSTSGLLENKIGISRCLQLAPEKVTHDYLLNAYGSGYISADLYPQNYWHAQCLKIQLPNGFEIFPNGYFDLIIHNHVLEHIPGSFRSHIDEFHRLLKDDSVMAFTIPDGGIIEGLSYSVEGGESLPSDKHRLHIHGQSDHYKTFGKDLIDYLRNKFANIDVLLLEDSCLKQRLLQNHNASGLVFWCVK